MRWTKVLEKFFEKAIYGALAGVGAVMQANPQATIEDIGSGVLMGLITGVVGAAQNWNKHRKD